MPERTNTESLPPCDICTNLSRMSKQTHVSPAVCVGDTREGVYNIRMCGEHWREYGAGKRRPL